MSYTQYEAREIMRSLLCKYLKILSFLSLLLGCYSISQRGGLGDLFQYTGTGPPHSLWCQLVSVQPAYFSLPSQQTRTKNSLAHTGSKYISSLFSLEPTLLPFVGTVDPSWRDEGINIKQAVRPKLSCRGLLHPIT